MKERFIGTLSGLIGGTPIYGFINQLHIDIIAIDVVIPICVAFACGIAGFYGAKAAQKIEAKRKKILKK